MQTVLIKKYPNNKMYIPRGNTESPGHTSIKDIVKMIQAGKPVKVVEEQTGVDITEQVLKLALKHVSVDVDVLHQLVRGGVNEAGV